MELARQSNVARGIPLNAPVIAALSITGESGQQLKHRLAEKHAAQDGLKVDRKVVEAFPNLYGLVRALQIDPGRVVPCNLLSTHVDKVGMRDNAASIAILDVSVAKIRIIVDSAALRVIDTITHRNQVVVREWLEAHLGDDVDLEARKRASTALAVEYLATSERIAKQGQPLMLGHVASGFTLPGVINRPNFDLRSDSNDLPSQLLNNVETSREARLLANIFSMTVEPRVVVADGLGHYIDFSATSRTFILDPVVLKLTEAEIAAVVGYGVMRANLYTLGATTLESREYLARLADWHLGGGVPGNLDILKSALVKIKKAGFSIEPRELRAISEVAKQFQPGKKYLAVDRSAGVDKLAVNLHYGTSDSFTAAEALALDIGGGGSIFMGHRSTSEDEAVDLLKNIVAKAAPSYVNLMAVATVLPVGSQPVASNIISAVCDGNITIKDPQIKDLIRAKNSFLAIGDFVGHSNLAQLLQKMPRERRVQFLLELCGGASTELDSDQSARTKLINCTGKDSKSSAGNSFSDYLKLGNLDAINFLNAGFGAETFGNIVKVLSPERFAKDAELSAVVSKLRKILIRRWGLALVPTIRANSAIKAECLAELQACFREAEGYASVVGTGIQPQVSAAITSLQKWLRVPQGAALLAIKVSAFEKVLKGDVAALTQQLGYLQGDAELVNAVLPKFLKAVGLKKPPAPEITLPLARVLAGHVSSAEQAAQMTAFLLRNHANNPAAVSQSLGAIPANLVADALVKIFTDGSHLVSASQTLAPELAALIFSRVPDSHLSGLLSKLDTAAIQSIAHHIPAERRATIISQSDSPKVVKDAVELRNRYEALLREFGDVTDLLTGRRLPNYYAALGSPPSSTPQQLKQAYNKLNFAYHQDRFHHEPAEARQTATVIHAKIVEAYKFLSDPEKRARYNSGTRATAGQAKYSRLFPSESLFSEQS